MRLFLIFFALLSWIVRVVMRIAKWIYLAFGFVAVGLVALGIFVLWQTSAIVDGFKDSFFAPIIGAYWGDSWSVTKTIDEFPDAFILTMDIDSWLENANGDLNGKPWKIVLTNAAERLAEDERVKGLIIRTSMKKPRVADIQFLNRIFSIFRDSNIKIFAHTGRNLSLSTYALLQNAQEIWTSPTTNIELKGYGVESYYYGDASRSLGVSSVLVKRSEYKSAGDSATFAHASEYEREQVTALLDDLYAQSKAVALDSGGLEGRGDFDAIVYEGIYTPKKALDEGLIDGIGYYNEVEADIVETLFPNEEGHEDEEEHYTEKLEDILSYMIAVEEDTQENSEDEGLVVYLNLEGPIYASRAVGGFFSENYYGINLFEWQDIFRGLAEDDLVDGVIMRISSPGGEVFASDELSAALHDLAQAKPLVVLIDDVAASGGYYMASSADKIIIEKGAVTGSIGVVFQYWEFSKLLYKLGINVENYGKGRFASGWLTTSRRPTTEELGLLEDQVDYFYQQFVETVAKGRDMPAERVYEIAKGRIWSGERAVANGLADSIGSAPEAVEEMRKLLELEDDQSFSVQTFEREENLGGFIEKLQQLGVFWREFSMLFVAFMHSAGLNADGQPENLMVREPLSLNRQ